MKEGVIMFDFSNAIEQINNMMSISNIRKSFYLEIINIKYEILNDIYKKLNV